MSDTRDSGPPVASLPGLSRMLGPLPLLAVLLGLALYPLATHAREDRITIAVEGTDGRTGLPAGWSVKSWQGETFFEVVRDDEAGGGLVLHLRSNGSSGALYRDVSFDIKDFPILRWRWKSVKLPRGADVRVASRDDQAAQLYVIFPVWPEWLNTRAIGYIWDTSAPAGMDFTSKKHPRTRYVVMRSGPGGLGTWHSEQRNVYDDYRRLFGEDPPMVGKVSVMIDSDDVSGSAESFIGGIYFSPEEAPALFPPPPATRSP